MSWKSDGKRLPYDEINEIDFIVLSYLPTNLLNFPIWVESIRLTVDSCFSGGEFSDVQHTHC
ncbi:hypothetical protein yfred0001_39980 [Yersinia frederiksenii ATCC 33641]|nr:hypothetical protein yfred0001_39980 [Yersinia frederiksenii ATCC 33641]